MREGYITTTRLTQAEVDNGDGNKLSGGLIEILDINGVPTGAIYTVGSEGVAPIIVEGTGGTSITVVDDDTMANATATNVPSAESVKAYVDANASGGGAVDSVAGKTGVVTLVEADITDFGTYEVADLTILKEADLGVTVQDYDANLVSDSTYVATDENYLTTDKTKLDFITVTQDVDLDAIETDVADNTTDRHTADTLGTKTVDETGMLDGQFLAYNDTSGNLEYVSPAAGSTLIDDDTFVSALADNIASAESIKAYVDANGRKHTAVANDTEMLALDAALGDVVSIGGEGGHDWYFLANDDATDIFSWRPLFMEPAMLDDDTFTTASASDLASSESIKAYVDNTAIKDRLFLDDTTVAPAITDAPTVDEITTAAAGAVSVVAYYTGTDVVTNAPTYVYIIDASGVVTETKAPGGSATDLIDHIDNVDTAHGMVKNNITVVPPNIGNDSAAGYEVDSIWIDTVTTKQYVCTDATIDTAVWAELVGDNSLIISSNELNTVVASDTATRVFNNTASRFAVTDTHTSLYSPNNSSSFIVNDTDMTIRKSNVARVNVDSIDSKLVSPDALNTIVVDNTEVSTKINGIDRLYASALVTKLVSPDTTDYITVGDDEIETTLGLVPRITITGSASTIAAHAQGNRVRVDSSAVTTSIGNVVRVSSDATESKLISPNDNVFTSVTNSEATTSMSGVDRVVVNGSSTILRSPDGNNSFSVNTANIAINFEGTDRFATGNAYTSIESPNGDNTIKVFDVSIISTVLGTDRLVLGSTASRMYSPNGFGNLTSMDLYNVSSGTFIPSTSGGHSLGNTSFLWSIVYAINGTIQTSDEVLKKDIRPLDEVERAVSVKLRGLIKNYKWKDDSDTKIHTGIIAQEVVAAFASEGLDAHDYSIISYEPDELDEDGNAYYGVNYTDLMMFILATL